MAVAGVVFARQPCRHRDTGPVICEREPGNAPLAPLPGVGSQAGAPPLYVTLAPATAGAADESVPVHPGV
eukprot:751885-Hanusia_phi.AAC.3